MDVRILESRHGGWVAEIGLWCKGGEHIPGITGVTMSTFIVYESARFDTLPAAKRWAKNHR